MLSNRKNYQTLVFKYDNFYYFIWVFLINVCYALKKNVIDIALRIWRIPDIEGNLECEIWGRLRISVLRNALSEEKKLRSVW